MNVKRWIYRRVEPLAGYAGWGLMLAVLLAFLPAAAWAGQGAMVCVTAPRAELRQGPSLDFPVTWVVMRNMPLLTLAEEGLWLKVRDVDGETHYVPKVLVSDKASCATVNAAFASVYKGPSSTKPKWHAVTHYTVFPRLGEEGGWIKVGQQGEEELFIRKGDLWP